MSIHTPATSVAATRATPVYTSGGVASPTPSAPITTPAAPIPTPREVMRVSEAEPLDGIGLERVRAYRRLNRLFARRGCVPRGAGHRRAAQDLLSDLLGRATGKPRLGARDEAVCQDSNNERLDVVGQHVVASRHRGARLR